VPGGGPSICSGPRLLCYDRYGERRCSQPIGLSVKEFKPVEGFGESDLEEVLMLHIDLGDIQTDTKAQVVPKTLVDILLGQKILVHNGEG